MIGGIVMKESLAETHPFLIQEWSDRNLPLTPAQITYGSNKRVWWRGTCGHEWQAVVYSRGNGSSCPVCEGRAVRPGYNDLQTTDPELCREWDYGLNRDLRP